MPAAESRCPMWLFTEPNAQIPDAGGAAGAECLGQRRYFNRVAERRAGAVGLHVADGVGRDAGHGVGHGNHLGLALDARGREADLRCAVVVGGGAANDGVDGVAVGQRVLEPAQQHHADAVAEDGALRRRVERPAVAVGRADAALLVEVAFASADTTTDTPPARAASHCQVSQRLARLRHGHERRGAGRLHVHAGAAQVELVGNARRQVVVLVPEHRR